MAVPFLRQPVPTALPAWCRHQPTGQRGPAVNVATEQGVVLSFVSCSFLGEQDAPAELLCHWRSLLTFSNMAGTNIPSPTGIRQVVVVHIWWRGGGHRVKGGGNTEQLQSRAYKYTPAAVAWWAVEAELCFCLLLLPTSLWWNPAFLHKEFTDSKAALLPRMCLLAAGSSRQWIRQGLRKTEVLKTDFQPMFHTHRLLLV